MEFKNQQPHRVGLDAVVKRASGTSEWSSHISALFLEHFSFLSSSFGCFFLASAYLSYVWKIKP
jgi:hypothetical protein